MKLYSQGRWLIHEFDSLGDFADSLVEHAYVYESERVGDLLDKARHGWDEELPQALEVVESVTEKLIRDKLIEPAFKATWDVAGSVVDVGRFVSNEPECMIAFPPAAVTGKPVITIVTSMSLGAVSASEVLAQGRAVCALVMAIQATGRNVEVWSDNVTTFQGRWQDNPRAKTHTVKVKIKGANDVLDPGQLIFALANYGMGRTLGDSIYPRLDGRINEDLERKWRRGQRGAGAADPCPDLYPEGALILPKPTSFYTAMHQEEVRAHYNNGEFDGDWEVPDMYLAAAVDFVMKYMRKLGLVAES
ncbi:hypothetical protein EAS64_33800 [Trebonia kvetii]|uniref:DUF7192 domain-containing protein n=1 Tax=Trebonia kvetii TaxID=2480626 RepID=A0A6P2BSQ4_9ACTN|nr:hypothetical protein [Trebonia kvetii]TVZ01256.1 hypothetical protein EAS64_33800 [Trebonia kvetii]